MAQCLLCGQRFSPNYSLRSLLQVRSWYLDRVCPLCWCHFEPICATSACPQCGRPQSQAVLCYDCQRWREQQQFLTNRALFKYNQAMQAYFQQYKGVGDYRLRGAFSGSLRQALGKNSTANTLIVPIPTSPSHLAERGFDPVLGLLDPACRPSLILASRDHQQHQAQLSRAARLASQQYFYCPRSCPQSRHDQPILLVDDIYTTGRTLLHAQTALRQAGYQGKVTALTLAR
ncbi:ComF family protein [Lapidilactobacillus luobeiensis]|uniref:ComF family protein n=1 Tax=Lapidilactobacillus luobeiensis TaxID=2950371 RepID=UPI0021C3C0B2|nr:ComF family protein [Lapidilactobacillus luobeiensis]